MNIGKRLRELREAKGSSQTDIEHQTGLSRTHVSRIENGHSLPSLRVLARWAKALDVDLQLSAVGDSEPEARVLRERVPIGAQERTLLGLFGQMPSDDRSLLISFAREMLKKRSKRK